MFSHLLMTELIWRLGWTLVHSLWQGCVVWWLVIATLALLAHRSPRVRYLVACCGMLALILMFGVTFTRIALPTQAVSEFGNTIDLATARSQTTPLQSPVESSIAQQPTPVTAGPSPASQAVGQAELGRAAQAGEFVPTLLQTMTETLTPCLPTIVLIWCAGVVVLGLWNLGGWIVVCRLRCRATLPAPCHAERRLNQLAGLLRVSRPVQLVESLLAEAPTAVGWLRPVILLPLNMSSSLTPAELDAVLSHELA